MKNCFRILFFMLFPLAGNAQTFSADSLRQLLKKASNDSIQYGLSLQLYEHYEETNKDSALYFAEQCLELARKNNQQLAQVQALTSKGYQLIGLGRYAESFPSLLNAFQLAENPRVEKERTWRIFTANSPANKRLIMLAYTHHIFAILMWQTQNPKAAIDHFMEARRIGMEISHPVRILLADMNLGRSYLQLNKLDSALFFEKEAEKLVFQTGFKKYLGSVYGLEASIYLLKGDHKLARQYFYKALEASREENNMVSMSMSYFVMAKYYLEKGEKDSALQYALKNLEVMRTLGPVTGVDMNLGSVYENIYLSYKLGKHLDSAYKYLELAMVVKDSLYKIRIKNLSELQQSSFREQFRLQDLEKERVLNRSRTRTYALLGGLTVFLLVAVILFRNNRQKHRANLRLEETLADLKATQAQLIQSEKMASLGELTAGIAHEIQNPLNFVNNFSEVNRELLGELKEEGEKGNWDEVKKLALTIIGNEDKILQHGKRADAIVKGMLQHSRSSSGVKEPTDINALADEYLRLAYHGLRAKDKSFNATMKTDFDPAIGTARVIPQDIGRVILNLITNAFYAVAEKKKQLQADPSYEPLVIVSTRKSVDKVEIKVRDNGNGIPQKVLDKIFQPFFTTKPTGQGTGLGLSLSYDIIKAHGGELKVNTADGAYAEFVIILPL